MSLRWLAVPLMLLALVIPRESHAIRLNKNVKDVFVASGYGLVAGTAVGLAILPLTQDLRVTLMGSSVGLYLGIAAGVFYVLNRPASAGSGAVDAAALNSEPSRLPDSVKVRFDQPWVQAPILRF